MNVDQETIPTLLEEITFQGVAELPIIDEPFPVISKNSDNVVDTTSEVAEEKEIKMADIVTGTVTGQLDTSGLVRDHADIRREQEVIGSNIRRETAKEASDVIDVVKTAAWHNSDRTGTEADRIVQQDTAYFIAGQQYAFSNATAVAALKASTDMGFQKMGSDIFTQSSLAQASSALESAKVAAAVALGQAQMERALVADGNNTRALINELKMEQLNRELIERNSALVEARGDARHWQSGYSNAQFASVSSQLNAFASQLQEVKQGTVNFGTMSGNAGRNTSTNNVV